MGTRSANDPSKRSAPVRHFSVTQGAGGFVMHALGLVFAIALAGFLYQGKIFLHVLGKSMGRDVAFASGRLNLYSSSMNATPTRLGVRVTPYL